ncbi:glycosyltransferase [Luteolibacter flavescens]|uniref:Glycosyltransferase n=1 Tax=Luteolibacter flavescens TaxID=1859460 RepID=A0ABT3FNK8_9BACT|nr:glycosyltransferase [Luteolibacter flavescens]MCW1885162.1 glycosyltransferase [Luteolibacter flavescens]
MEPNTVISIIVPLHQDAALVDAFTGELDATLSASFRFYEIVLVDDGSTDGTTTVVREMLKRTQRVRYLRLSRSFGREVALSAGIESSIGDYVVTLDPRTDPVAPLPDMIAVCRKTGGVVHGIAANPVTRSMPREWIGEFFRNYCRKRLGVDIKRGVSDLRVMSRQAVNALLQVREQSRYLRVLTLMLGYHHEFFPYDLTSRPGSERKSSWRDDVATAIDLLAANTRHPLRLVTVAGLLGAGLNLLYAVYVVTIYFTKPDVAQGWTTLSLQQSGMFFFVCLILAVLSEYVGTILGEVRSRPRYFVAEEANSSVLLEDTVKSSILGRSDDSSHDPAP